jgi:hypothetical protein
MQVATKHPTSHMSDRAKYVSLELLGALVTITVVVLISLLMTVGPK